MDIILYTFLVVRFLNDTSSTVESDGSILFTVISLVTSDNPFTVQVCTRDSDPLSAEGLLFIYVVTNLPTKSQTPGCSYPLNQTSHNVTRFDKQNH